MATESPLLHDGSQNVLSTTQDARRTSITGSTMGGPNGSGQFLCVVQSTTNDRTVLIASTAPSANVGLNAIYGILQNTPGPGQAADVGIFGISKAVVASTAFVRGDPLGCSSALLGNAATLGGGVQKFSTASLTYNPIGYALETPSTVSQVITIFLNPSAHMASTA